MFYCIKWQQLFKVFHSEHNTHVLCEMEKFANIWLRRPQQDFIMPPNIRLDRHPHTPHCCKIFCQTSSVLTCRNHTVCQCSWCCMQNISLLITPATIWSPVYPNLWTCLLRDSGLFIFLTQILIWSYTVAVFSQLYLTCIQEKELHTHTHTLLSNILNVFYSSSALQPAWPFSAGSCPTNDMSDPFWQ